MADRSGFPAFVSGSSPRLLRTAYLLTHDRHAAEDLLQSTLAKTWVAWPRIEGDPEPYVRRTLTTTYVSWWRRRSSHEKPMDDVLDAPSVAGTSDERVDLWAALGRAPPPATSGRRPALLGRPARGGGSARPRVLGGHREVAGQQGPRQAADRSRARRPRTRSRAVLNGGETR